MSDHEQEFDGERLPHLRRAEIERLKDLILDNGIPTEGIFSELPMTDESIFFTYSLDAKVVDERWRQVTGKEGERITDVTLEYNKHLVDDQRNIITAAVAVEVKSVIAGWAEDVVNREVRYILPLEGSEPCLAKEHRSDEARGGDVADDFDSMTNEELVALMQSRPDRGHLLLPEDIKLLKLIISLT